MLKYFGNSTQRNPRRWLMSIPPLQARTVWSFMVTLTDVWLSVTSWFCGTAGMFFVDVSKSCAHMPRSTGLGWLWVPCGMNKMDVVFHQKYEIFILWEKIVFLNKRVIVNKILSSLLESLSPKRETSKSFTSIKYSELDWAIIWRKPYISVQLISTNWQLLNNLAQNWSLLTLICSYSIIVHDCINFYLLVKICNVRKPQPHLF